MSLVKNNIIKYIDSDSKAQEYNRLKIALVRSDVEEEVDAFYKQNIPKSIGVISQLYNFIVQVYLMTLLLMFSVLIYLMITTNLTLIELTMVTIPIQFGVMGITAIWFVHDKSYSNIIHNEKLDLNKIKIIFKLLGVLLIINLILTMLIEFINIDMGENLLLTILTDNPEFLLVVIPMMFLLVAPVEEYIFRGVIQGIVRDAYNVKIGIIISSIWFGLAHIMAVGVMGIEAIPYVITTVILGVALSYYYEQTKSLTVPIIAHALYNCILIAVFMFMYV